jgi:hypothetical protein
MRRNWRKTIDVIHIPFTTEKYLYNHKNFHKIYCFENISKSNLKTRLHRKTLGLESHPNTKRFASATVTDIINVSIMQKISLNYIFIGKFTHYLNKTLGNLNFRKFI